MVDFVDEVGDAIRKDEQMALAKRLVPYAIVAVVGLVVAVGGFKAWQAYSNQTLTEASVTYEGALKALDGGNVEPAKASLKTLSVKGPKVYRSLALMQLAAVAVAEDKLTDALRYYDQAAPMFRDPLMADAARLKAAYIAADVSKPEEFAKRVEPLTKDDNAYRYLARELEASAAMKAGETAKARKMFEALALAMDAPAALRDRANATLALLPKTKVEPAAPGAGAAK